MPHLRGAPETGDVLADLYELQESLSSGGMGQLYRATHQQTGQALAVKVLKPECAGAIDRMRLNREAKMLDSLRHPHVVRMVNVGETPCGAPFLVMELLEGRSLRELLQDERRMGVEEMLQILLPIVGAVASLHDLGLLHRDLTPGNIFLHREGTQTVPKLLDFGLVKEAGSSELTAPNVIIGTPHYMSPEQALAEPDIGAASDIWALGAIMYRCLTGEVPFTGTTHTATLLKVLNDRPKPMAECEVPHRGLSGVIERALARRPAHRYSDARDFARALLVAALGDQLPVPNDPDPLGLPAWTDWHNRLVSDDESTVEAPRFAPEPSAAWSRQQATRRRERELNTGSRIVAQPMRIKAQGLLNGIRYIEQCYGFEALESVLRLCPAGVREQSHSMVALEWFPESDFNSFLEGCERVVGTGDGTIAREIGAAGARANMRGVIKRSIFYLASPNYLLKRIASMWRQFNSEGSMQLLSLEQDHGIMEVEGLPYPNRLFCATLSGWIAVISHAVGLRNSNVVHVECRAEGAERCTWHVTWHAKLTEITGGASFGSIPAGPAGSDSGDQ